MRSIYSNYRSRDSIKGPSTRKPCAICKETGWRAADSPCPACLERFERLEARAKEALAYREGVKAIATPASWPSFKSEHYIGYGSSERLHTAFRDLCRSFPKSTDEGASVNVYHGTPHEDEVAPDVRAGSSGSPRNGRSVVVMMHPDTARALEAIHNLIGPCIDAAYDEGYRDGRNLLARLASGDLTPAEFSKKEIESAAEAQRRKNERAKASKGKVKA